MVDADYVSVNTAMLKALNLDLTSETLQVGETTYAVNYMGE